MNILEYEAKEILKERGITVPRGIVAHTPDECYSAAEELGGPVMVKVQMRTGRRGTAGGVVPAETPGEAALAAARLLEMNIAGYDAEAVLVEKQVRVQQELYAGVTVDRAKAGLSVCFSREGGTHVEDTLGCASRFRSIDSDGLMPTWYHRYVQLARRCRLHGDTLNRAARVLSILETCCWDLDAVTVEVNPLGVTDDGELVALDARIRLDESALFRQERMKELLAAGDSGGEAEARRKGLAYVPLPGGDIAIIASGAGLGMATMDTLASQGMHAGTFIDVGGGVSEDTMAEAVSISTAADGIRGIVVNMFGGLSSCEPLARGVLRALRDDNLTLPVVVKIRGYYQEEAWRLLETGGVPLVKDGTTGDAVSLLAELMDVGEVKGS